MPTSTPLSLARKARSHLDRVIAMLERDEYCISILQQTLAVQGLVKRLILDIFSRHLRSCFAKGMRSPSAVEREKLLRELDQVMRLSQRS